MQQRDFCLIRFASKWLPSMGKQKNFTVSAPKEPTYITSKSWTCSHEPSYICTFWVDLLGLWRYLLDEQRDRQALGLMLFQQSALRFGVGIAASLGQYWAALAAAGEGTRWKLISALSQECWWEPFCPGPNIYVGFHIEHDVFPVSWHRGLGRGRASSGTFGAYYKVGQPHGEDIGHSLPPTHAHPVH